MPIKEFNSLIKQYLKIYKSLYILISRGQKTSAIKECRDEKEYIQEQVELELTPEEQVKFEEYKEFIKDRVKKEYNSAY